MGLVRYALLKTRRHFEGQRQIHTDLTQLSFTKGAYRFNAKSLQFKLQSVLHVMQTRPVPSKDQEVIQQPLERRIKFLILWPFISNLVPPRFVFDKDMLAISRKLKVAGRDSASGNICLVGHQVILHPNRRPTL